MLAYGKPEWFGMGWFRPRDPSSGESDEIAALCSIAPWGSGFRCIILILLWRYLGEPSEWRDEEDLGGCSGSKPPPVPHKSLAMSAGLDWI